MPTYRSTQQTNRQPLNCVHGRQSRTHRTSPGDVTAWLRCRLIRGMKNRYGAIEEVGVFSMSEKGLEAVPNPSALFLTNRDSSPGVSSAVTVQMEGTRPLLLEVQALCSPVQVIFTICICSFSSKVPSRSHHDCCACAAGQQLMLLHGSANEDNCCCCVANV